MVHVEKIDEVQEYVQFHLHFLLHYFEMIYFDELMMIVVVVDIQLILLLLNLNQIEVFQIILFFNK